jgi:hypothetical protein
VAPKKYRRSHTFSGTGLLLAAAAVLSSGAAGCSNEEKTYGLQSPPGASSPTSSPTGLGLTPEQKAVADAVTRYDAVIKTMSDGARLDMNKIRTVAVDPWATKAGRNLLILKAQKYRTTGKLTNSTRDIKISASRAVFVECSDSRGQQVVTDDSRHETVTAGAAPRVATSVLVKINGHWFVQNIKEGKAC